jgi:hypothetical protein
MLFKLVMSAFILNSFTVWGASPELEPSGRRSCPSAMAELKHVEARPLDELQSYLKSNSIRIVSPHIDPQFVEQFIFEFNKFPESLKRELIRAGAKINLIQGDGVVDDPTWDEQYKTTFDGRDFSKIPGTGGFPYVTPVVPTRLVVNNLYDYHGSTNLVLHEHGHTLDSIYSHNSVSDSKTWKGLINNAKVTAFIKLICGSYCTENRNEGFAEMFTYYHACEASRQHMAQEIPEVADFFKNLTTVRAMLQAERSQNTERKNEESKVEINRRNGDRGVIDEARRILEERREQVRRRLDNRVVEAEKKPEQPVEEQQPVKEQPVKEQPVDKPVTEVKEENNDLRSALNRLAEERRRKEEERKKNENN